MADTVCPNALPPSNRHRWIERDGREVCARCEQVRTPMPHELWTQAGGDRAKYIDLLKQHGHLVPMPECDYPGCAATVRHTHDAQGRLVRTDVFGHRQERGARHGR